MVLLIGLVLAQVFLPGSSFGKPAVSGLLKQAQAEKDPAARIHLLDRALKIGTSARDLRAALYFERGMAHKEMKDCFGAIRDFNSALFHSRQKIPALLEKTHCLIVVDQLEEAGRVLERVLLARPNIARAYVLKGMIYEKEGFLSKASDEFTRALHYDATSTDALEMRAMVLLKDGKPLEALDDLNELSRLAPHRPDVLITRARVHEKLKQYAQALEDYERAESSMQDPERLIKGKAIIFIKTDQPERALTALSSCPPELGQDIEILVLKARAHILMKDYATAEAVLRQVLSIKPDHAPAHLYLGVVAMASQDWDQALADLGRAIDLDASLAEAYKQRAQVFMELDEPVRAFSDLTAAADEDPSDGGIFAMRGLTNMRRMLYQAAIADFTRALDRLPGDPRILYDRAVAYTRSEEWEKALMDLDTVLERRPNAARALSLRGIIHFHMGRMSEARTDFDHSSAVGSQDPLIWNNRGLFLYRTGDHNGAIEDFNKALQLDHDYDMARHNLEVARKHLNTYREEPEEFRTSAAHPDKEHREP